MFRKMFLLLLMVVLLPACGGAVTEEAPLPLGPMLDIPGTVTLLESERIGLNGFDAVLEMQTVLEDNRCPGDATCLTGGQVRVQLALYVSGGEAQQFVLTLGDQHAGDVEEVELGGVVIRIKEVNPYPFVSFEQTDPWTVTVEVLSAP
jgi:hypothetical protein